MKKDRRTERCSCLTNQTQPPGLCCGSTRCKQGQHSSVSHSITAVVTVNRWRGHTKHFYSVVSQLHFSTGKTFLYFLVINLSLSPPPSPLFLSLSAYVCVADVKNESVIYKSVSVENAHLLSLPSSRLSVSQSLMLLPTYS